MKIRGNTENWGKKITHRHLTLIIIGVVLVFLMVSTIESYLANQARVRLSRAITQLKPEDQPKEWLEAEKYLIASERATQATLAQILGGAVIIVGLYFTYQNTKTAQDTLRVTEEGKLTDRFSKAIELIGEGKAETSIGGIYALEQLAKDSAAHHWTVMEVLTSYIRRHSPLYPADNAPEASTSVTPDVQAAIDVIGRRHHSGREHGQQVIDLTEASLRSANLSSGIFRKAVCKHVDFYRANLKSADFRKADLSMARLSSANVKSANFIGANLAYANLDETDLSLSYINWEDVRHAYITHKTLLPAPLEEKYKSELKQRRDDYERLDEIRRR